NDAAPPGATVGESALTWTATSKLDATSAPTVDSFCDPAATSSRSIAPEPADALLVSAPAKFGSTATVTLPEAVAPTGRTAVPQLTRGGRSSVSTRHAPPTGGVAETRLVPVGRVSEKRASGASEGPWFVIAIP